MGPGPEAGVGFRLVCLLRTVWGLEWSQVGQQDSDKRAQGTGDQSLSWAALILPPMALLSIHCLHICGVGCQAGPGPEGPEWPWCCGPASGGPRSVSGTFRAALGCVSKLRGRPRPGVQGRALPRAQSTRRCGVSVYSAVSLSLGGVCGCDCI